MKKTTIIPSAPPSTPSPPETSSATKETDPAPWPRKLSAWFCLKKLQYELWSSEKFQKECEQLGCFNMAELEEKYQSEIVEKIRQLKRE